VFSANEAIGSFSSTRFAVRLSASVPLPSCPNMFLPQHHASAAAVNPQVTELPAAIRANAGASGASTGTFVVSLVTPLPSCQSRFSPQHHVMEAEVSPHECRSPVAIPWNTWPPRAPGGRPWRLHLRRAGAAGARGTVRRDCAVPLASTWNPATCSRPGPLWPRKQGRRRLDHRPLGRYAARRPPPATDPAPVWSKHKRIGGRH